MENTITVANMRSIKSLYTSAKHFDELLRLNGASYSERLDFAIRLYEMNGVPIPEITIKSVDAIESVREFLEKDAYYPIRCKVAYNRYVNWCKDAGYLPLAKQRFISCVKDIAGFKYHANIDGVSYSNVITSRPSEKVIDMEDV